MNHHTRRPRIARARQWLRAGIRSIDMAALRSNDVRSALGARAPSSTGALERVLAEPRCNWQGRVAFRRDRGRSDRCPLHPDQDRHR